ncbi:hypothetical protein GLOTRDRAFT_128910 [Gloeophyllum trabeum ATCC 11539]|uniref:ATP synthase complex subunit H-domain-containing protein n=1 Tax=Gloeophyllum trabeum (strain ATCC 11539 / FP-39264 / Madison 617) TaxID=670483 RepID=S7Q843_GLOTA|nr:uncharacterized protein GLOTRDRAFT_128910 [Gloeophyllum trabeum ATCC 11539]EPQ55697.1 hypothetical protein GLOTRDRAFT_128910 [Gloeophyllum trabeum ATCC 11539]
MSAVLRQAATAARSTARFNARALSTSPVSRKDLVQEIYVKEIKSYKAPPLPKDAHVGHVKPFSAPSAPKPPTVPADLASELSAYDAQEPVKEASKAPAAAASTEEVGTGADAFLAFLEADPPKGEEAHH